MSRLLVVILLTLVGAAGCGGSSEPPVAPPVEATAVPAGAPAGPVGSAFWRAPREVAAGAKRGDVLWARQRRDAPAGSRGWNIVYVSQSAIGSLTYVSGEVYVPDATPPSGGRSLVIWNHGTAGTQDSCAPSRNNLVATQQAGERLLRDSDSRVPALMALLQAGHVVAMSDYQGLGTPPGTEYLNGPTQGMAALDVSRAARTLLSNGVVSLRVAMYGFSQGGQTSLWAAHLAASYAPELELRGVVAIAPAARQLALSFYDLKIPENSGYFISRMAGLAVGRPDVRLTDMLTPAGLQMLDAQTWDCFEIFQQAASLTEPYAYPAALEPGTPWRRLLEANDAFLPIPPSIPVFVIQGDADVDVGVGLTRDMVRDLCAGGSVVEYQERAGVNHMDMNVQAATLMPAWFAARFAGQTASSTCASLAAATTP